MIVPSSGVKVLIAMKPVDFRKGMDGLAAVVHETLGANPFGGVIYVFRSKRADRVKLLFWDGNGPGSGDQASRTGLVSLAVVARGGDAADTWATRRAAGGLGLGAGAWGANTHADGGFVIGCYIFQVTPTIGADSVRS